MSITETVPVEVEASGMDAGWRHHALPVFLLVLMPILASVLLLTGIFDNNPALFFSFLSVHLGGRVLQGPPAWLDPTISLLTQPLGHLSAQDWLHGIVPWWNPYTGIGMPLAAEMQTLSFFLPFVLLLKFSQGWLYLKVILQIISGLAMYALLIELGCRRLAAFVAGMLFALNGTFFLVPHAMGPIPFLPLLLLGIERAARAARAGAELGWGLIPLALAYSLYGGYPEIAYLDGLLAAVWTIWRLGGLRDGRMRFVGKIALGVGLGVMLSLPLVVPFLHYVQLSYLGAHRSLFSIMWLGRSVAPAQFLPFTYGLPGYASSISVDWVEMPGWFGLPAAVLALAACIRPIRHRTLVLVLLGFVLFWQARIWGVEPVVWLANLIPDIAHTDAVRFVGVAMEAAVFIMAGLGLDQWLRMGALNPGAVWKIVTAAGLILVISFMAAAPVLGAWYRSLPGLLPFGVISDLLELGAACWILRLLARPTNRRRAAIVAGLVVADAFVVAFLPQLSSPRTGHLDLAGVRFLQRHQGTSRDYSLQPFGPDYPAQYDVASINDNALPVARSWQHYLVSRLDPFADVVMFTGAQPRVRPSVPDQATELRRNLPAYAATGVKYVLVSPGDQPFRRMRQLPVGAASHGDALGAGQSIGGTIAAGTIRLHKISVVEISIGTFKGAARGRLDVTLCAGADCANGHAILDHTADDAYLPLRLDHDLAVPADAPIRYRFTHQSGSAVALWLGPLDAGAPDSMSVAPGRLAPPLRFLGRKLVPVARVFHDQVMTIYRLPDYRRFYSASRACALTPKGWNHVIANCTGPSRLLRLEAWFPGWHATLNGRRTHVFRSEDVFQSVALPAGRTEVSFFYRPRGTRMSVAAALAALLLWIGLITGVSGGVPMRRKLHRDP